MKWMCACLLFVFAASTASAQEYSNARGNLYRLKWGAIAGIGGAAIGGAAWAAAGPCQGCPKSAGQAIAVGAAAGMFVGMFVASFSAPGPERVRHAPPIAPAFAVGSRIAVQPVLARGSRAAVVRLRF